MLILWIGANIVSSSLVLPERLHIEIYNLFYFCIFFHYGIGLFFSYVYG